MEMPRFTWLDAQGRRAMEVGNSVCTCGLRTAIVSECNSGTITKPTKVLHLNGSLVRGDKQEALNRYIQEAGTEVLDVFAYLQLLIRAQRDHLAHNGHAVTFRNMEGLWKANEPRALRKASLQLHPDKAPSAPQLAWQKQAETQFAVAVRRLREVGSTPLFAARAERKDQRNTFFKSFSEANREVTKWMMLI